MPVAWGSDHMPLWLSGPLTEANHLGNVAYRWQAHRMECTGNGNDQLE